ncbi:tRNA epoxyqueuosine(34) reductase QueG [Telmatospirillum siberiense]|uniref:Epoxyqueuosine reductase n=1 Tax=Telmatospirillum siberiense TaxID=382514 RepID=A0A2N3PPL2_9PROT|nr:tRNA epoxyqueuosine(34) reductase QueG [Telmatospirillum siberiense]PKU22327.1 tRNA epoxyqueuosine(34) reductase QueG [Telmatospirillum siberiense]
MKEAIRAKALELGFAEARFAPAAPVPGAAPGLAGYLAAGCHGEMAWMAETAERRAQPRALWPEAASVIVLGENYGPGRHPLAALDHPDRGHISVYARGRDYHDVLKKRLKALARWLVERHGGEVKVFSDTAPVMEKPLAAVAGLGWQGRHTNLVSQRFGSWLFLGEVFTTLEIPPDPPEGDHCGRCRACETSCPTGALVEGRIDPRRCVSYLTIEHKGHIPRELRALMGNRIYGCDDCLAVCPWNKFAVPTAHADYLPRAELLAPRLADLASLDDEAFRSFFSASPIKRIGRDRFLRNVLIALGNSTDPAFAPVARRMVGDASPLVRGSAIWALRRLLPIDDFTALRALLAGEESDAAVALEWGEV